jgi:hypothetical protein
VAAAAAVNAFEDVFFDQTLRLHLSIGRPWKCLPAHVVGLGQT